MKAVLFGVNHNPADNYNPIKVATRSNIAAQIQVASAATYIALDLGILCLPLPVIKNLHMRPRKKFLLSCLFLLGGL